MKEPIIIKKDDIERKPVLFGGKEGDAGWWRRIITPSNVDTKGISMGDSEVNPGFAAHSWHTHTYDKKEHKGMGVEIEIKYPKKDDEYIFEEFYRIISGSGVIQWEAENGKIKEVKVNAGDTIFFPRNVVKHQLVNNGKEKIYFIWAGSPPGEVNVRPLKK